MTTDTQDLIARLRTDPAMDSTTLGNETADKLEALQDELAQLNGYVQKANADVTEACVERDAARARLAELEKQEPIGMICGKRIEPKGTSEFFGFYFDKDYNPTGKEKIYAAAGASPLPTMTDALAAGDGTLHTLIDKLQAENAKLITALAECRDAFPVPDAGSRLDDWYCSAMADPLQVPEYVKSCVGASPQPSQTIKDHEVAELVNQLTGIAKEFHDHQSLRQRISQVVASVRLKPSQDADPNAPWLTEAHMLCTDQGVPQCNITDRIRALRDKLEQPSQAHYEEQPDGTVIPVDPSEMQPSQAGELLDYEQKAEIVSNWFSDEDMQSRAMQMLGYIEQAINAKESWK